MKEKKIKICLIDDHDIFRNALEIFLTSKPQFKITSSCQTGLQGLAAIASETPDIVILDIEMPELDGIKILRTLREKYENLPILILSFNDNKHLQAKVITEGASGIIAKSSSLDELLFAINSVIQDGLYLPTEIGKLLINNKKNIPNILTNKELRVIELLVNEITIDEIAKELSITKRSTINIRAKVMNKVGVTSSYGLARYAIDSGLLYFTN